MLYGQAKPITSIEELIAQMQQGQAPQGIGVIPEQPQAAPDLPMISGYAEGEDIGRDIYSEQNPEPEKKLGLFGRIRQQPGGSKALLAMGASLLSDPDFFSGFGKGALAYQNVLDEEKEKLKPKTEYLAQGAFQMTYDPATGKRVIERTPVADFESEQQDKKLKTSENIAYGNIKSREAMNAEDNETILKRAELEAREAAKRALEQRDFDKWKVETENANRLEAARISASGKSGEKTPASVLKMVGEKKGDILFYDQTIRGIDEVISDIDGGKLSLSLPENLAYKAALATGVGVGEGALAFQKMETTVQRMRNALLRANTGVQTNFDAQVAMLEIAQGRGDEAGVKQALQRMRQIFSEYSASEQEQLDEIERQYGSGGSSRSTPSRKTQSIREKYGLE